MDLSPGREMEPVRADAGEIFFCMENPYSSGVSFALVNRG
jgi:hypothetical protein